MELTHLKYPKKSHRKLVTIPCDNTELAELMGIIAGDGGIGNNWQVVISLNSILDIDYSTYILTLFQNLFSITPAIRKRPNQNTLVVVATSTSVVDFLVSKGAIRGNKILQKLSFPTWILQKREYQQAFIRGLVDTDGCIYTHKHVVNNKSYFDIGLCFTNFSPNITITMASLLLNAGLKPHVMKKNKRIYLYGETQVVKYLNIFGSSNRRIINQYNFWRDARAV